MRDTRKSAVTFAGAGALAVLLATSAFAQNTPRDAQSRQARNGRQQAAASNGVAHNQQQTAPQVRQTASQFRQNAPQVQQTAPQFRQAGTNQGDNGSRNIATQANRGYQAAPANNTARNFPEAGRNSNWSSNQAQAVRAVQNQSSRNNERVTLAGRVSSFTHEGNGYRVHLDRDGRSFWIPESRLRNRNDLRVGLSLSLGGIFDGGLINVDAITYPGTYGYAPVYAPVYDQGYVRGVVDRVDYRTNTILVRDEASGRLINVDLSTAARTSGIDARNVRPGDYLTLSGQWDRGGVFEAYRVDTVNPQG